MNSATQEIHHEEIGPRTRRKILVIDQSTLNVLGEIILPAGEGHQMAIVQ